MITAPISRRLLLPLLTLALLACQAPSMHTYALRLRPGADLRQELEAYATEHQLQAGVILTCVGSLTEAQLRLANQPTATRFEGPFEIVSLVGTLSPDGVHLHLSISDSTGRTLGGHLMPGCRVYTTAEIALAELSAWRFAREPDPETTYDELKVYPRP
jgi:predicted DNA-binding protein with PD1-like motif